MYDHNVPVFEVAWEVAHKVGGIYTVIRTKAGVSVAELGDRYHAVGMLNERQASTEVEDGPLKDWQINQAVENMRQNGVKVKTGRWLVDGYPQCILFDLGSVYHKLNEFKAEFWEKCKIDIGDDKESEDALVLGNLVCWFLDEYIRIRYGLGAYWCFSCALFHHGSGLSFSPCLLVQPLPPDSSGFALPLGLS